MCCFYLLFVFRFIWGHLVCYSSHFYYNTHQCVIGKCVCDIASKALFKTDVSHLHVEIVMLAGMLILLLMTANTLMLYSTPASRLGMVQEVMLPGILISNWTPNRDKSEKKKIEIMFCNGFNGRVAHSVTQ